MSAASLLRDNLGASGGQQLLKDSLGATDGAPPDPTPTDVSYPVTEYFSKRPPPARVRA